MNTAQRCFTKKPQDINASYEAAIRENPANQPTSVSGRKKRAIAKHTNFWAPGRTLRIAFLDGDQAFKDIVKAAALTWQPHINLTLDFVEGTEGEIRITSTRGYYWSYTGTNALLETEGATMSLSPDLLWYGFIPNVIHEFGHALGAEHEHLHPEVNIPWNKQAVYEAHGVTEVDDAQNRYIKREVDERYFDTLDASEVNYSPYDPLSIMHYEVQQEWTIGDFEIELNEVLSEADKAFMAKAYPYPEPQNK
ncbi:hypothetical protein BK659_25425 [Pseudomonas brassicacearum]|uniref:Peptidase M12 n=1 Tax=Pseudomonas brassicacearum TaxID=930166 RepID=A0A423GW68_9PSED|nr:hypothetical protein [Pseudomonas brassicacearum]RON01856.1 hypothetical protein BK659_25425 [Pseudomonas brassicacearum]